MVGTGVQVAGKEDMFVGWTTAGWTTAVGILATIATAATAGIAGLDVTYHTTPPAPTSVKPIMIAMAISTMVSVLRSFMVISLRL